MAWETRRRGGRYYTRSRKVRGRVVREYVGTGQIAELCAQLDAMEREERDSEAELQRAAWRERNAHYAALFGPLDMLDAACDALVCQELEAAGYHQHHRGEWRRRRGS
jgi:hypothetical protein